MVKRKWWKKDKLWVEQQLIDLLTNNVCLCWNWKISVGDPNPFFPKQFQISLTWYSVVDPKKVEHFWGHIYISPWESKQEPTFEVLLEKWFEIAKDIYKEIDVKIKCSGVCKKCW